MSDASEARRMRVHELTGGNHAPASRVMPSQAPDRHEAGFRCLTVKFPWVSLLGDGRKTYELRKHITRYRGPVVLCSSASDSRSADAAHAVARYAPDEVPRGHALYLVDLVHCFPARQAHAKGACCDPCEGEWVWEFDDVKPLPKPQPISGLLRLYYPPDKLVRYMKRAKLL